MLETNNMSSSLVISEDVIATIALNAAKDVDGVADFGNRPEIIIYNPFKINSESLTHVKVSLNSFDIKLCMYVILEEDAKIKEVSENIQNAVKSAIQNMTGRIVTKVDITFCGIKIGEPPVDISVPVVEPNKL